ncbi:hypothetical protein [Pedobacter sp. L105]|uniref:hypothetical protein n=1 Tax=Pedobacter sp. L105 TaxID=1641871 RepID=UPI00131EC33A|nr:hypothetical protein [Pedobacter sp. L105]
MRKIIVTCLFIIVYIFSTGCEHKKNKEVMFEEQLKQLRGNKTYQDVLVTANKSLNKWLADGLEDVLVLNDYNWKVDDAVFFNSKKNRCYLLLIIQDKDLNATLDYIYVMYGALEHGKWTIYFEGLPGLVFPRDRYSKNKNAPIPLDTLSKAGREEALRGYYNNNGSINDEYIEKAYTEELRRRHEKFLNKNQ